MVVFKAIVNWLFYMNRVCFRKPVPITDTAICDSHTDMATRDSEGDRPVLITNTDLALKQNHFQCKLKLKVK